MELEEGYRKNSSSGNGTDTGYTVEARFNYVEAEEICGQIFDNRWRTVIFKESEIGVPMASPLRKKLLEHRLLSLSSAQALRWWFIALYECQNGQSWCLETRLIKHKITYSHKIEAIEQCELIPQEKITHGI